MEVRAGLGVVTVAVLGGELATAGRPAAPAPLAVAAAVALVAWAATRRPATLVVALALAAATLGAVRLRTVVTPSLAADHVARLALPRRVLLSGRIVTPPERRGRRVVVTLAAEAAGSGAALRPASGLVRVTIRRPTRRWRLGERIALETTLRRPRNFENPGGFDYVGHLARRGVHVTAFAWDGRAVRRLTGRVDGLRGRVERWRTGVGGAIARAVPGPAGAVLQALVVGDESRIDARLREGFTRAGVVHVLSISGLHIGLVATAAFLVARWLLARSERLLLSGDVERTAALLALGPVALYTVLAGLGIPVLRAAIMVAGVAAARLMGRPLDVLRALTLAAMVLAVLYPGAALEPGPQLSFASVLAIVCGVRRLGAGGRGLGGRLRTAVVVAASALLGTAPLTAFHFHQVSLAGLLANPLVVPLFGSVVVVLGLLGAVLEPLAATGAAALFRLAGVLLLPGIALVEALGRPGWAALDVPTPSLLELGLAYAVLVGVLLPRGPRRLVVVLASIGLVVDVAWWVRERYGLDHVRVTFLDVGQGDAAVAELPGGRVLVVDAGGFPGSEFDTGATIVEPFLRSRKILHADVVAMTHAHPDHSGGMHRLLRHSSPREFWWTGVPGEGASWRRLRAAIVASRVRVRRLHSGPAPPGLADVIEVLHPPPAAAPLGLNDSSLTLRLGRGAERVLLTGDIEALAETQLLAAPARLGASVLKVPHHGSRTSSTAAFVAAVSPEVAIVSVGADNRYGLPAPEVLARYRAAGACVLRTDECGAVTVELGRTLRVRAMRPECGCPRLRRRG